MTDKANKGMAVESAPAGESAKKVSHVKQPMKSAARPLVTVFSVKGKATKKLLPMPDMMLSPIRSDLVNFVHKSMAKNKRQPYAVMNREGPHGLKAGMQVAAKSWGTGRAVARVPRVKGGGTHRAGQGAYANMCRGGRRFAPTKVWRKWHQKINKNQKRYAVCSAVAASAVPALVMSRGHRIQPVREIPIILEESFSDIKKTKACKLVLRKLQLGAELRRCKQRYMRAGRGKSRNRRWKHRLGPLIIYKRNGGIVEACRNLRGVDCCHVSCLNLLKLAPGGHLGRLLIWTEDAFQELNDLYGTLSADSTRKNNYRLPRAIMTNSDLMRIINSEEVQSAIRPRRKQRPQQRKRNPLKDPKLFAALNPLFEQQWQTVKKDFRNPTAKLTTSTVMRAIKKRNRDEKKQQALKPLASMPESAEERQKMQKYWDNVYGTDKLFKSRKQLRLEREAVLAAIAAAEREKKGLDLLDAMDGGADEEMPAGGAAQQSEKK